ncbi:DUF3726 domain-containing protein [Candidatus Pelagibacter sp. HIMB1521]|uniref:DUF3726 domain-containing protein n=1 Tax=Candidatus Pelagibacter sp. HIMB1521 TaxID=3413344 RepID=UPI003F837395
MKSFSEIETTVKRAAKASGYSWGVAEETAKCVRLLESFGLPGIKHINKYFSQRKENSFQNLNLILEKNLSSAKPYCPIILGVSFLDQSKSLESFKKIELNNVAYPSIFLAFVSRASEIIGKKIHLNLDKKEIILNLNLNLNIYSNIANNEFPTVANHLEISFLENIDNFSEEEWKNLYKLSEDTFVEESESLKQGGAGAGLTDND